MKNTLFFLRTGKHQMNGTHNRVPLKRHCMKFTAEPNLKRHISEGPNCTQILFVIEKPVETTDNWLVPFILRYANYFHFYNFVVMYQFLNQTVHLSAYLPHKKLIFTYPDNINSFKDLFTYKGSNLNGGPFRVAIFPEEVRAVTNSSNVFTHGSDFEMAKVLAKQLNGSLQLYRPLDHHEYGNSISDANGTGALGQVMRGEVDISINSRILQYDFFQSIDIVETTVALDRDDMCVLVPINGPPSTFSHLIHSLDTWTWALTFISIILFRNFVQFTAQWRDAKKDKKYRNFSYIDTIQTNLNQMFTTRRLPKAPFLRLAVVSWLLYCFFMTNIFQCCITSAFTMKWIHQQNDIKNMKDLANSNYRILVPNEYELLIRQNLNYSDGHVVEIKKKLLAKILPVSWTEYKTRLKNNDVLFVYANRLHLTKYYANTKLKNGMPIFFSLAWIPSYSCYIIPIGSPFHNRLNKIIIKLLIADIYQHWDKQADPIRIRSFLHSKNDPEALRIENIAFCFYFLIIGCLIAFIRFMFEIRSRNRSNK